MLSFRTTTTLGKQVKQRFVVTKRLFTNIQSYDALVLNAYTNEGKVSLAANKDISQKTKNIIEEQLKVSNFKKAGDVRTLYNIGGMKQVAIVSLGKQSAVQKDEQEAARRAVSCIERLKSSKHINHHVNLDCSWLTSIETSRGQEYWY